MPVLFLLSGPKMGFSARRALHCPDNGEIWHGGADWRLAPPCQLSRLSRQKCGNTAPKTVKIANFGHKFAPLVSKRICTAPKSKQSLGAVKVETGGLSQWQGPVCYSVGGGSLTHPSGGGAGAPPSGRVPRHLHPATRATWQKLQIFKIQDGGRPPFWQSLNRHISVKNCPLLMKFGTLHHILNPMTVMWPKIEIFKI